MPTFEAIVGPDGTITLPSELRERLALRNGSRVEFFLTLDGQVHFHAITQVASRFGGFNIDRRNPPLSVREMDDGIAEHLSDKFERSRPRSGPAHDEDVRSAAE